MLSPAHNDVIDQFDPHNLACSDEVSRHPDIGFGRISFTTRMIVHQENCRCRSDNCSPEYLPWMNQDCIHSPYRKEHVPFHFPPRIEKKNNNALALWVELHIDRDMKHSVNEGVFRGLANRELGRNRTLPQRDDFEFDRLRTIVNLLHIILSADFLSVR